MLKRDKLESLLRKISDKEFEILWKDTYGYVPSGERRIWRASSRPNNTTRNWTIALNAPRHT